MQSSYFDGEDVLLLPKILPIKSQLCDFSEVSKKSQRNNSFCCSGDTGGTFYLSVKEDKNSLLP